MKNLKVLVEKEGNVYGASIPKLPGVYTAGDSIDEIKSNILEAVELHIEGLNDFGENKEDLKIENIKFEFIYDLPSFFGLFNAVSTTAIAEIAGLNASLVRQYATRKKYPSETQSKKIEAAIHKLGEDLLQVQF